MDNWEAAEFVAHSEDPVIRILAAILLELRELRAEQQDSKGAPRD